MYGSVGVAVEQTGACWFLLRGEGQEGQNVLRHCGKIQQAFATSKA